MQLIISRKAQKQYQKLPSTDKSKIKRKLNKLPSLPFSGKSLKGKLAGSYSIKVWPYRIIYQLDDKKKIIWIISIIHRQSAYN